ncbi:MULTISPECIES: DNA repair protein RecN [Roseobacteraceae]|uniref:DNA repair protein RecN n=1 Tax=Roseobacteraceae TaxID=2854170 RepID=UPI00125F8E52|nr:MULTISPECIES: DNA repair protein RecN [Roseobacteraceae]KAB6714437.1 DNA repair protein RecN [Roseobacter sp. TSBP12]|tara:strand:+ start:6348 stop:8000 length:1653 start_codon:yes stop_codon:yes gene_type:complete
MLRSLDIRDMLIIDRLELEFQPGLNVLTGETGAGKSILLDSLGFVLGWRGRADLVRAGAAQGEVTAVFDLPRGHDAEDVLKELDIEAEDGELILRRVNAADGRKTAWVNDRRVSGDVLRRLSDVLVELHGQHDDRGLLNPRGHRALLDSFGGLESMVSASRQAWKTLYEARKALAKATKEQAALKDEEEFLRHTVAEFDKLNPEPGEEAKLDAQRRLMQSSEKIAADVAKAHQALSYDGGEGMLADALRWLEGAAEKAEGRLEGAIESLGRALNELADAQSGVESCIDALRFNPHELEEVEERLFAIRGLARKHSVLADDLGGFADALRLKLTALDSGAGDLVALAKAVETAETTYEAAANTLTQARTKAAAELDSMMAKELAPLKMERAVFSTQITAGEPGAEGRDTVAFTVATNPGAPAGPIGKIASGGELSRFLLALKVCLTRDQSGVTMIFDEIDRGVGGATADAVGRRLKALASEGQVLVVTHSPQVAALGGHHWRVAKRVEGGMTLSEVTPLDDMERIDELARMLAGDTITEAARDAARALLIG